MIRADFVIIGGGIVGLAIARELRHREPDATVVVLEKEPAPGRHSSGRNSGVLHSGIYYPPGSLKSKVCSEGQREMADYCVERGLPYRRLGKILVPTDEGDGPQLDLLFERGRTNGVAVERLDSVMLTREEPEARSATGNALLVASTAVVDSQRVVASLVEELRFARIDIRCGGQLHDVRASERSLLWRGERIMYGHIINTAGLHADRVAHRFGVGRDYTLLPFKGIYWKLDPAAGFKFNHLIYPVPDLRVPFLGIHTTTAVDGSVYLGPTAIPAFGRENYRGLAGVELRDSLHIIGLLAGQYWRDNDGFRRLAWQEGRRVGRRHFAKAAQTLLPRLRTSHLLPCDKVGLRAQMLNRKTGKLVTDFLIEEGPASTHVLNAISPAFTSAFALARVVCDGHIFDNKREIHAA